jgi:hypothetical protein
MKLQICSALSFRQALTPSLTAKQCRFPESNFYLLFYKNKNEFLFNSLSIPFPPAPCRPAPLIYEAMTDGAEGEVSSESPPAAKRRDVITLVGCHNEHAPLGARQQRLSNFLCKQSPSEFCLIQLGYCCLAMDTQ